MNTHHMQLLIDMVEEIKATAPETFNMGNANPCGSACCVLGHAKRRGLIPGDRTWVDDTAARAWLGMSDNNFKYNRLFWDQDACKRNIDQQLAAMRASIATPTPAAGEGERGKDAGHE